MNPGYAGERIALLTQHGKERVIAPVLEPALACRVELVGGFDTDQLGSFTRETPRPGTQLEAARRKARIGMELSGLPIGLASEGSFGPDPFSGLFPWNVEMLVLIDDRLGLEVVGLAQGPGGGGQLLSGEWPAVEGFARREGFPEHQLVLRPDGPDDARVAKGIADWARLRACYDNALAQSARGQVFVEPDLRAFANPTRLRRIGEAAQALARRLASHCPACGRPGYGVVSREGGLPCADCGLPTRQPRADVWQCGGCGHRESVPRTDRHRADPQHCDHCNP